jgi:hypothetical protein
MRTGIALRLGFCVLLVGCASTEVNEVSEYMGRGLPKPDIVLVHDFAVSRADISIDDAPGEKLLREVQDVTPSEDQIKVGRAVANALAEELVKQIHAMGMPAQRASELDVRGNVVSIQGHFLEIDEGNRMTRIVIGLGFGGTEVRTRAQMYQGTGTGRRLLQEFETIAKSGKKPGMAETMGAGAVVGSVGTAAVTSSGMAGASEHFGGSAEAGAKRTAEELAKEMSWFFVKQGWIEEAIH